MTHMDREAARARRQAKRERDRKDKRRSGDKRLHAPTRGGRR